LEVATTLADGGQAGTASTHVRRHGIAERAIARPVSWSRLCGTAGSLGCLGLRARLVPRARTWRY